MDQHVFDAKWLRDPRAALELCVVVVAAVTGAASRHRATVVEELGIDPGLAADGKGTRAEIDP